VISIHFFTAKKPANSSTLPGRGSARILWTAQCLVLFKNWRRLGVYSALCENIPNLRKFGHGVQWTSSESYPARLDPKFTSVRSRNHNILFGRAPKICSRPSSLAREESRICSPPPILITNNYWMRQPEVRLPMSETCV
jgi:hypothetical protein